LGSIKNYTGVKVLEVNPEYIATLYTTKEGSIDVTEINTPFYENEYVVLKCNDGTNGSVLTKVKNQRLIKLNTKNIERGQIGLKPRNKEQIMALDALLDDSIQVVALTGTAGAGKSLLAIAAALHKQETGQYNKIILTRPMSQVGQKDTIGFLPGEVNDKFTPFLSNYFDNFEHLVPDRMRSSSDGYEFILKRYNIECKPLALIRGASWCNAFIIADEVQALTSFEMLTLGTRTSEGSKLVLLGDLKQIDGYLRMRDSGLFKFINNEQVQHSNIAASIHMLKSERGPVSTLFSSVFEEPDE